MTPGREWQLAGGVKLKTRHSLNHSLAVNLSAILLAVACFAGAG